MSDIDEQTQLEPRTGRRPRADTGADLTTGDLVATPAQTIGPFYGFALEYEDGERTGGPWASARRRCACTGTLYRRFRGTPVPDALVEIWQAR